jgi:hypothetical protein
MIDSELTMKQHISEVTAICFYQLWRLRQVLGIVEQELTPKWFIHAPCILSRLDYGCSVLAGLPKSTITPLQRLQNVAVRLVLDLKNT